MLVRRQNIIWIVAFAVLCVGFGGEVWKASHQTPKEIQNNPAATSDKKPSGGTFSKPGAESQKREKKVEQNNNTVKESLAAFFRRVFDLIVFVDRHEGFFLVVFTAIVALFTWRLYSATSGLANAERPQLLPEKFSLPGLSNLQGPDVLVLDFSIKNFGRTPAVLKRMAITYVVGTQLTRKTLRRRRQFSPIHMIVPPEQAFIPARNWPMAVPGEFRTKVVAGTFKFFLVGTVEYSGVSGDRHSTNFAYEFLAAQDGRPESFVPCGPRSAWRYS